MMASLISLGWILLSIAGGPTRQTPSDARSNQFEEPKGTSWRVFAVDTYEKGPISIIEVQEVRQQNPPSRWAVLAKNRSSALVMSYSLGAAIVTVDGNVKAIQTLPSIKNLKPDKVARQEIGVILTVLAPTDRVVFFVNEVSGQPEPWKAAKADVSSLIKEAAKRLPVP